MSNADEILYAPVDLQEKKMLAFNIFAKGQKVPQNLLRFADARVVVLFGVDVEVRNDNSGTWIYPLAYLKENECVVQITYPENHIFSNKNNCIISYEPHPDKRDPNHTTAANSEAVREIWP